MRRNLLIPGENYILEIDGKTFTAVYEGPGAASFTLADGTEYVPEKSGLMVFKTADRTYILDTARPVIEPEATAAARAAEEARREAAMTAMRADAEALTRSLVAALGERGGDGTVDVIAHGPNNPFPYGAITKGAIILSLTGQHYRNESDADPLERRIEMTLGTFRRLVEGR